MRAVPIVVLSTGLLAACAGARGDGGPAVPLPDDAATWRGLPATVSGGGGPLPVWAKAVAVHLPRTAAAMIELDREQRTRSPLDPALRARMRWVVAHANR